MKEEGSVFFLQFGVINQ